MCEDVVRLLGFANLKLTPKKDRRQRKIYPLDPTFSITDWMLSVGRLLIHPTLKRVLRLTKAEMALREQVMVLLTLVCRSMGS